MYVIWEPSEGFLNMGAGGMTRYLDVTCFASDSAEIWSGGEGIAPPPCTPGSDGPVYDMGVYPCQTSVLSPITPSFAFFALFEH